jgi:hypothetical protein
VNPDANQGSYPFVSIDMLWGDHAASSVATPAQFDYVVGIGVGDQPPGPLGPFDVYAKSPAFGGGLSGDPLMGLPLPAFELSLHDGSGTALSSDALPTALDIADYGGRFGQLVFGDPFAGPIVSLTTSRGLHACRRNRALASSSE